MGVVVEPPGVPDAEFDAWLCPGVDGVLVALLPVVVGVAGVAGVAGVPVEGWVAGSLEMFLETASIHSLTSGSVSGLIKKTRFPLTSISFKITKNV